MEIKDLSLKHLKDVKTISFENGNTLEFIESVSKSEWRQSAGDNKSRAYVSVNGEKSNYPLYIDEIRRFAETGENPAFKPNYLGQTAETIAAIDDAKKQESAAKDSATKEPRKTTKEPKNSRPLSEIQSRTDSHRAAARARFMEYRAALFTIALFERDYPCLDLVTDCNIAIEHIDYMDYKADKAAAHRAARIAQLKRARAARLERLKDKAAAAQSALMAAAHSRDSKKIVAAAAAADDAAAAVIEFENRVFEWDV